MVAQSKLGALMIFCEAIIMKNANRSNNAI